ncbi:hypothetical protein BDV95DRAFT_563754 [Massariosphaeria phaeospora]|uniref:Zn(2)-C6 fungal-type domain-containing protein n=1 Tax=Massariosphaeria phaeospora TaxID=100035 RepID=A0A7C8MDB1_9PLEO|nr:hypothetical protein BDV95DRAFT_563754 [Massariosphaeria phaeospora]
MEQPQPKRAACDRCRAQKLRCVYNDDNPVSCERCRRARVRCNRSASLRMGRRPTKERQDSTALSVTGVETIVSVFPSMLSNTEESHTTSVLSHPTTPRAVTNSSDENSTIIPKDNSFAPLMPASDTFLFDPSLPYLYDMDFANPEDIILEDDTLPDLNPENCSNSHSVFILGSPGLDSLWDSKDGMQCSPDALESTLRKDSAHNTPADTSETLAQKLSLLNIELQNLVLQSENKMTLCTDLPRAAQSFLDILNLFQNPSTQTCSACEGNVSPPYSASDSEKTPVARPYSQGLFSIISCYLHLLRLYSDFFDFIADTLTSHTSLSCTNLTAYFPEAHPPQRLTWLPVHLTGHLQIVLLVDACVYMLSLIELTLGCPRSTESGYASRNAVGLLSRYRSLVLLETMMKHEDMESQEHGRRSLRMVSGYSGGV